MEQLFGSVSGRWFVGLLGCRVWGPEQLELGFGGVVIATLYGYAYEPVLRSCE